jgi:hypothetical protein
MEWGKEQIIKGCCSWGLFNHQNIIKKNND